MNSISSIAGQDPSKIQSRISYECHSLMFHLEIMKSLNLEDVSDDEDSEYGSKSEASENENEDYFEEDLFGSTFNHGNAHSSEDFQHHANERKVRAIMNGTNLLTYDFGSDLEEYEEDTQDELNDEEKEDTPTGTNIAGLVSHHDNLETKPRVSIIEDFERQAIQKKIRMGKIRECNAGLSRFQYIKQYGTYIR